MVGHIAKATYLQPNVGGVSVLRETELLLVSYYTIIRGLVLFSVFL